MRPVLQLSLQFADATHRAELPRHRVSRWIRAALAGPGQNTVRIVEAEAGRALTRDYRGNDYATNVLTFVYDGTQPLTGDIVLCTPVVEQEAQQQHKDLMAHYAHLVVHGVLHLQGYDHETSEADADLMEAKEAAILENLLCFNHG